jgi:hypothetical protein
MTPVPKSPTRELYDHILSGQNVVLYGEKSREKTSLLSEVFSLASQSHDVVKVDLVSIRTADDVVFCISSALHRIPVRKRPKEAVRRFFRKILPAGTKQGWQDSMHKVFNDIERAYQERPLVVVLDEFQGVLNCEDSDRLIALLRSHIQHQPDIPYIFAGSTRHQMYDIFMGYSSPFFKSALPMDSDI